MNAQGDGSPEQGRGVALVVALCAAQALSMSGFGSFPALQPQFLTLWSLSNTQAGWINGIYYGAYVAVVPVLVSLTDRVDPRYVYIVGAVVAALSQLAFALLVDGFWGALAVRALAGAGLAGTYMPGLKALADHVAPRLAARGTAFYTASFSIGVALSFFVTGELDAVLGWPWAVGLAALGPLAAGSILLFAVPPAAAHHLDPAPARALLDFRPVFANRRAFAYILAYTVHNWELFALRGWVVTFLVYAQGLQVPGTLGATWSATAIASLMIMIGLPASVLGNEAAQAFGRRRVVVAIMAVSALIGCLLGFTAPLPFLFVVILTFVYTATVGGDSASITAGAIAHARPGERGATMAVHSFIGFMGAFLGPLAFGVVLDLAGGGEALLAWGLAFASAGLVVALGPLVLMTMGRRAGA
jgi:MFS family permease